MLLIEQTIDAAGANANNRRAPGRWLFEIEFGACKGV
jgi:hypothetical protein